jgi:dienelactone hydrolase
MIRSICIVLLAIFILVPVAQSDENENQGDLLAKYYKLEKPIGKGPFPAVMMVSGCSGFDAEFNKKHYNNVQKKLVELGFVTLRVNYLAVRNIGNCQEVSSNSVAGDICIAADFLKQQSFVKKGAINVIGWSYGGASAFRALRRTGSREPAQVDAVIAYYPYCNAARHWDSEVPVLVLHGAIDNVATPTSCESIFSRLGKPNRLTFRLYDDAHHGFDNPELPVEMKYQFGTLGYNEKAAKASWIEVENFLKR